MARQMNLTAEDCKNRIMSLQEKNPMLGCRGCRLAIIHPEIIRMQTKAIIGKLRLYLFFKCYPYFVEYFILALQL